MPGDQQKRRPSGPTPGAAARRERQIVLCVAMAAFTFQFEAFLVNVALPIMALELNCTTTTISGIVIVYLLAATISFLPAGRLGDRYGLRPVFLAGCGLAALGTLSSGLAVNLWMLWISRFVQGVGAGAMVALGYAMIPAWLDPKRVGWGYGCLSLGAGLGMVLGLPVGGVLSHFAPWRWIFLGTFPVMTILLCLAWRALPRQQSRPSRVVPPDAVGATFFALALAATVFAISLGSEWGWASPAIVVALVLAALLSAGLVLRARMIGHPSFPREVLRAPGFTVALITLFLFQMMAGGILFLMPFYLRLSCGLSSLMSSLLLLAYPLSFAPVGGWAGSLADRIGSRPLVVTAAASGSLACGLFSAMLARGNPWIAAGFLLVFGISTGLFFAPNNRFAMSGTAADRRGEAGALLPVALNLGTILGISILDTALSWHRPGGSTFVRELPAVTAAAGADLADQGFFAAFLLASIVFALVAFFAFLAYRPVTGLHSQAGTAIC